MPFLLTYWQPIASAALVGALALFLGHAALDHQSAQFAKQLAAQSTQLTNQCNADKAKHLELENDLQKKNNDIARHLADYTQRLRVQSACVVPATGSASSSDGAAQTQRLSGGNGVSAQWLLNFAADCESDAAKLDTLQKQNLK